MIHLRQLIFYKEYLDSFLLYQKSFQTVLKSRWIHQYRLLIVLELFPAIFLYFLTFLATTSITLSLKVKSLLNVVIYSSLSTIIVLGCEIFYYEVILLFYVYLRYNYMINLSFRQEKAFTICKCYLVKVTSSLFKK